MYTLNPEGYCWSVSSILTLLSYSAQRSRGNTYPRPLKARSNTPNILFFSKSWMSKRRRESELPATLEYITPDIEALEPPSKRRGTRSLSTTELTDIVVPQTPEGIC